MNFEIWGLSGSLTTERPDDLAFAEERLWLWIREFDDACNRFRPDSEISRLNAQTGTPMTVSVTMASALEAAFDAAAMTEGLCDPTVLSSLLALGYDRDYDVVADRHDIVMGATAPAPGLGAVSFDRQERTVTVSPGTQLDLGASAKALVADLVAAKDPRDLGPLASLTHFASPVTNQESASPMGALRPRQVRRARGTQADSWLITSSTPGPVRARTPCTSPRP